MGLNRHFFLVHLFSCSVSPSICFSFASFSREDWLFFIVAALAVASAALVVGLCHILFHVQAQLMQMKENAECWLQGVKVESAPALLEAL